jgi:hypothetical protein
MLPQMHLFSPEIQKLVLAAESLMFDDVRPQSLSKTDLQAIRYYVQCLSKKFASPDVPNAQLNGLQAQCLRLTAGASWR